MLNFLKSNKLQHYFSLPFTIVGLVSLFMIIIVTITSSQKILQRISQDITAATANRIADEIQQIRENHQNIMQLIANDLSSNTDISLNRLASLLQGLVTMNQAGIAGIVVKNKEDVIAVLETKGTIDTTIRQGETLLVAPNHADLTAMVADVSKLPPPKTVSVGGKHFYVLWDKGNKDLGKLDVYIGLLLTENILKSRMEKWSISEHAKAFILDRQGILADVGLFLDFDWNGQSVAYEHPACWIRCTARDAYDQLGVLVDLENEQYFVSQGESGQVFANVQPIAGKVDGQKFFIFSVLPEIGYAGHMWDTLEWAIIASTLILSLFFALGYWASERISKPIRKLNSSVKKIGQGDWNHQIGLERKDEIGDLARSFKQMAVRMQELVRNLENRVEDRTGDLKNLIKK